MTTLETTFSLVPVVLPKGDPPPENITYYSGVQGPRGEKGDPGDATITDGSITNIKISASAAISESKLLLNFPTHSQINENELIVMTGERYSSGVIGDGPYVVNNFNGTVTIPSNVGYAWNGTKYIRIAWNTFSNQTPIEGINFVSIYANGTLHFDATEQVGNTYIRIGKFLKVPGIPVIAPEWPIADKIGNYQTLINNWIAETFYTLILNGFEVTEQANPNELKLNITGGTLSNKLNNVTYPSTTTFLKLYMSTDYGLYPDYVYNNNIIDTTLWCDATKTHDLALTEMTNGWWAKGLIAISFSGQVAYTYPLAEYATENEAKLSPIPLKDMYILEREALMATIIFQKGDTSIANKIFDIRPNITELFTRVTDYGTLSNKPVIPVTTNDLSIYPGKNFVSDNVAAAGESANNPTGANAFATMNDIPVNVIEIMEVDSASAETAAFAAGVKIVIRADLA